MTTESYDYSTKIIKRIEEAEKRIESHLDTNNNILIEFGYESRLLETILLASYAKIADKEESINISAMISKAFNNTFRYEIHPYLDLEFQGLLLELYHMDDSSDLSKNVLYETLNQWFDRYKILLDRLFEIIDSDFKKYFRKIASFFMIALFSTTQPRIQNYIIEKVGAMTKQFKVSRESFIHEDVWRRVYYYLFYCFKNPKNPEISEILEELFYLQSKNGTWNNNNLLTLLVVHTMRFLQFDKYYTVIVLKRMEKAEQYLFQHEEGLTVLNSQGLYNTVLYYSLKYLFTGTKPPNSLLDFLLKNQNQDGGWMLQTNILLSDVDTTTFAIIVLLSQYNHYNSDIIFQKTIYDSVIKGLQFIKRLIRDDGSCGLYAHSTESLPEMIARVIMLYSILPSEFTTENERTKIIRMSLMKLVQSQDPSGNFEYYAYSFSELYAISQVSLALFLLKYSNSMKTSYQESVEFLETRIVKYLSENQKKNGSFGPRGITSRAEQQSTCYAIMSMSFLIPDLEKNRKAIQWLNEFTKEEIKSFPEGTGPRPFRYNDLAHGPIFVYLGLLTTCYTQNPRGLSELMTTYASNHNKPNKIIPQTDIFRKH